MSVILEALLFASHPQTNQYLVAAAAGSVTKIENTHRMVQLA
jgi:hypothetical protein